MIKYTNSLHSGYDIAERYTAAGQPAVLRRAWYADLSAAEAHMQRLTANRHLSRIVDCATGRLVPWRGITGEGENAITLEEWSTLPIPELRARYAA